MTGKTDTPPQRLLIVMPSWVGDAVMATPTLQALRQLYPQANITCLLKSYIRPLLNSVPWVDRIMEVRGRSPEKSKRKSGKPSDNMVNLAKRLRRKKFDMAILLPNSFRTALVTRMAKIPRRIGYDRDGRGFLLTDLMLAMRAEGKYVPTSTLQYYLGIARYLGAKNPDGKMQLFTQPQHDKQAEKMLNRGGVTFDQPLVILNPGANYGAAKIWPTERFAQVADQLIDQYNAQVLVNGAPKERQILDEVHQAAKHKLIDLPSLGNDLTLLKSVVKKCSLMITNDTGPRHIAAAMGTPLVTLYGPTDPRWTTIDCDYERELQVDVFCGPCQKKTCPLDHRCMTELTVDMTYNAAVELLNKQIEQH